MFILAFIAVLLLLGIVVLAIQNGMPLDVKFIFWQFKTSVASIVLVSAVAGAIFIALLTLPGLIKKYFRERKLTKQVGQLEKEKDNLKLKTMELEKKFEEKGRVSEETSKSAVDKDIQ